MKPHLLDLRELTKLMLQRETSKHQRLYITEYLPAENITNDLIIGNIQNNKICLKFLADQKGNKDTAKEDLNKFKSYNKYGNVNFNIRFILSAFFFR